MGNNWDQRANQDTTQDEPAFVSFPHMLFGVTKEKTWLWKKSAATNSTALFLFSFRGSISLYI